MPDPHERQEFLAAPPIILPAFLENDDSLPDTKFDPSASTVKWTQKKGGGGRFQPCNLYPINLKALG